MSVGAGVRDFIGRLGPVERLTLGQLGSLSWISEETRSRLSLLSDVGGLDHSRPAFLEAWRIIAKLWGSQVQNSCLECGRRFWSQSEEPSQGDASLLLGQVFFSGMTGQGTRHGSTGHGHSS